MVISALGYGLSTGKLPLVLAIGYFMTALGGLGMLVEIATSTGRDDDYQRHGTRATFSSLFLRLWSREILEVRGLNSMVPWQEDREWRWAVLEVGQVMVARLATVVAAAAAER